MENSRNLYVPYVIEKKDGREQSYDLMSRLLEDRIIMIEGGITQASMNIAIAELLFLNSQDSTAPIFLYINSEGGSVVDGMALCDTMNFISAPVYTIATGMAASMGAVILSAGEKGHRYCLRSSSILVHPMSGGTGHQRTRDGIITMNYEKKLNPYLLSFLAHNCNKMSDESFEEISNKIQLLRNKDENMVVKFSAKATKELKKFEEEADYDHWMFPKEALEFGIVDSILTKEGDLKNV